MVGPREKRSSNASSRGIKSDRFTIPFTRVTQPLLKVERGHLSVQPPQGGRSRWQPRSCSAKRSWRILAGSEHRRRKAHESEVPVSSTVTTRASRRTSRRTPRHHGRRVVPQPQGWPRVSKQAGGTERSSFTFRFRPRGATRAAANEQGFRSLGCWRTECATHPPREKSRGRRTLKGTKAQGG